MGIDSMSVAHKRLVLIWPYDKDPGFINRIVLCELVWVLEAATTRAGVHLTAESFLTGLQRIGRSYRSVYTFETDFSTGRSDASVGFRPIAFVEDCRCFRYTGAVRPDTA